MSLDLNKEDLNSIWTKVTRFCSYRERCEKEIREKLNALGLEAAKQDKFVNKLYEENYINSKRFISSYVRGKLLYNFWGKTKIRYALLNKGLEKKVIEEELNKVNGSDYKAMVEKLIVKKKISINKKENIYQKKYKISNYLFQKGFEPEFFNELIEKLVS